MRDRPEGWFEVLSRRYKQDINGFLTWQRADNTAGTVVAYGFVMARVSSLSLAALVAGALFCLTACNWISIADQLSIGSPKGSSPAPAPGSGESGGKALADQSLASMAVLAGVDGTITALATQPGGEAHLGVNAIDVEASAGSTVWHQLGTVDQSVAGGWVYVDRVSEPGTCFAWERGSEHYSGHRVDVYTHFYDAEGRSLGWHRESYQHIDVFADNAETWWTWNNAVGAASLWPDAQLTYGDGDTGGLYLGEVFGGAGKSFYNGPDGELCHDRDHLHQEGEGSRDPLRQVSEEVVSRTTALHLFTPSPGYPMGEPPSSPGTPAGGGACGELTYHGQCDAGVLTWCEAGTVQTFDCATVSQSCGWQDDAVGNNCTAAGCGSLDFAGGCHDNSLRWCEDGSLHVYDCTEIDLTCALQNEEMGYNCL